jgi:hypothetical protein
VYESAIEAQPPQALSDADTRTLCLRYAALERRLGEVDRARAIYVHASTLADPRGDRAFWEEWNGFEVKHGNEDTFRWGARAAGRRVRWPSARHHLSAALCPDDGSQACLASLTRAVLGVHPAVLELVNPAILTALVPSPLVPTHGL